MILGDFPVRIPALLLILLSAPMPLAAQNKGAEYGPQQILSSLKLLREQRGDPNPPKLASCLKNSSDGKWSDLQAHFYCWLKADQRACFTGAVDGEFKDHPELKGNYDRAYSHCQEAKGRAYGINFDRPLGRLTLEQGEVFKNLLYRRPGLPREEQRRILEAFYAGTVPDRKSFPAAVAPPPPAPQVVATLAPVPAPAPSPVAAPVPASIVENRTNSMTATMANPDVGDDEDYPRSCRVKSAHARTRQKPDSSSPVVAILDPAPIKITGPALASAGADTLQWYPVEFHYRGQLTTAFLSVSLVECSR